MNESLSSKQLLRPTGREAQCENKLLLSRHAARDKPINEEFCGKQTILSQGVAEKQHFVTSPLKA